jgi:hypothetical protein
LVYSVSALLIGGALNFILTRKLHLSDDQSRHMCIKTFTKQNWVIQYYQSLLMKIFRLSEYHVSYKGAAGKAFSAHIPTLK